MPTLVVVVAEGRDDVAAGLSEFGKQLASKDHGEPTDGCDNDVEGAGESPEEPQEGPGEADTDPSL